MISDISMDSASATARAGDAVNALFVLRRFIAQQQLRALADLMRGAEGAFYRRMLVGFAERVAEMPPYGAQDGMGGQATAYLRYFGGAGTFFITERQDGKVDACQHQAFGWCSGSGGEFGAVSIQELIDHGMELDLYFEPCPLNMTPEFTAAR